MIQVKYFGMLAERLNKHADQIDPSELSTSVDLKRLFIERHPELEDMTFTVAVNQEIIQQLNSTDGIQEIALLPPFAGG